MMTATTPQRASTATDEPGSGRLGRLGTAAAWISAICCLPYLALKVVWALGVPVGITDESLLDDGGWVAANALMAAVQLTGLVLVLALTRSWARRVPTWLLLLPVWVGTGLLFQVVVGAVLMGLFPSASETANGDTDLGGIQPWVYAMVYASFAGQGVALAIAFACHVRARWGRLLGERTGDVIASHSARAPSSPEHRLEKQLTAVAAMAMALAVIFGYWTFGGSFGLSGAEPSPALAMQASRMAGAMVAAAGLLGLAGRWGQHGRFWLPAAMAWVGSGALVAFDALGMLLMNLLSGSGTDTTGASWSAIDTVLVIKVLVGMLAAALGALAMIAAARVHEERTAMGVT